MDVKNGEIETGTQAGVVHNVADEGTPQPSVPDITFTPPLTEAMEVDPTETTPETSIPTSAVVVGKEMENVPAPVAPVLAESAGPSSGQASSSSVRVFNPSEASSTPIPRKSGSI
jgi:hypothetical protein